MRFPLVLAAAVFPASLLAAGTTTIGPCPPGFVETGPRANGPVTILEGRTGGNVGCVPAPPLRAAEPAVQPTPFPVRDFRDPMPADASVLRLVSYNPPSPTALAQQTSSRILARTYDLFDRVESETVPLEDGGTATVRYTYWRDGLRKTLTDAFGRVTFYEYDGQARLSRVTVNQGLPDQHVTEYAYWPDDLLKTITAPNGVVTSYGYDLADRVTSIDIARDGVTLASYAYTYDANGNRLTQTETNGGAPELTTYTYDARDRLKTVTYPSGTSVEYGYDAVGNRTGETERNAEGTVVSDKVAVFDAINRLSSVTDSVAPSNNATFAYDANGNLTSKTTAAGTETYDYEPRDLMVEARQGTTVLARYAYDAFGRRYLKVSSEGAFTSVVRQYLYDQTSLLHELDDADLEVAKHEYGGDRLASLVRRDEPRRFYHQDALGSVVALSDSAGAVVARYHLDAWGRYRTPSELDASANRFGFTGYLFDQETSLYYAKARFYDPEYGRFTSQDSVLGEINEPPSLHRYFYGYANPLRYVDPTGRTAEEPVEREIRPGPLGGTEASIGPGVKPSVARGAFYYSVELALELPSPIPLGLSDPDTTFHPLVPNSQSSHWTTGANQASADYAAFVRRYGPGAEMAEGAAAMRYGGKWGKIAGAAMIVGAFVKLDSKELDGEVQEDGRVVSSEKPGAPAEVSVDKPDSSTGLRNISSSPTPLRTPNDLDARAASARPGEFSIIDWSGYPPTRPRPEGPFRLLEGAEYDSARRAADSANRALHKADPSLKGFQIHEIHPVKFDGSPTDVGNKTGLSRSEHALFTAWWNKLMKRVKP